MKGLNDLSPPAISEKDDLMMKRHEKFECHKSFLHQLGVLMVSSWFWAIKLLLFLSRDLETWRFKQDAYFHFHFIFTMQNVKRFQCHSFIIAGECFLFGQKSLKAPRCIKQWINLNISESFVLKVGNLSHDDE